MATPRILVVDDDPSIRQLLAAELHASGFDVSQAAGGDEAAEIHRGAPHDLVVTDLAMPAGDGFSLIERLRADSRVPILVLSVRGREEDKILALDRGADDYVTKPFSVPELLARVRAQLRRTRPSAEGELLEFPDLSIDLGRRRVVQGGREVRLTPTEFAILELFARSAGRPLTFERIVARVWGGGKGTSHDTVRVHVGALRRKIEPDPSNPRYVVTEPWVGYRFLAEPVERAP